MKHHFGSFLLGVLLLGFGFGYFWYEVSTYKYHNEAPKSDYELKQEEYRFTILDDRFYEIYSKDAFVSLVYDETLDKEVIVSIKSYPTFAKVQYTSSDLSYSDTTIKQIRVQPDKNMIEEYKTFYSLLLSNLKDKAMYNYAYFFKPQVEVKINPKEKKHVNIKGSDDLMTTFFSKESSHGI